MTHYVEPTNDENVIDSRDVIAAIETLENAALAEFERRNGPDAEIPDDWGPAIIVDYIEDEETNEYYRSLVELARQGEGAADWRYGETLIRESYFEEYAEQLADDIGYLADSKAQEWPFRHIDWKAAAEELKEDYFTVEFDGVTYYIR
jgi:hypothetical protein